MNQVPPPRRKFNPISKIVYVRLFGTAVATGEKVIETLYND